MTATQLTLDGTSTDTRYILHGRWPRLPVGDEGVTCPHCHADTVLLLAKGQRSCGTCGHLWSAANRRRAKRRRKALR